VELEIERRNVGSIGELLRIGRRVPLFTAEAAESLGDLVAGAEEQDAAPQVNHVAVPEDAELHVLAVDLRAVGALQVGDHVAVVIFLNLDMEAADPLVVALDGVPLIAAAGGWRRKAVDDP